MVKLKERSVQVSRQTQFLIISPILLVLALGYVRVNGILYARQQQVAKATYEPAFVQLVRADAEAARATIEDGRPRPLAAVERSVPGTYVSGRARGEYIARNGADFYYDLASPAINPSDITRIDVNGDDARMYVGSAGFYYEFERQHDRWSLVLMHDPATGP
jgi:hypothetical protein